MSVFTPLERSTLEAFLAPYDLGRLRDFRGIALEAAQVELLADFLHDHPRRGRLPAGHVEAAIERQRRHQADHRPIQQRAEPLHRREDRAAGLHEHLALGRVVGLEDLLGRRLLAGLTRGMQLESTRLPCRVRLDEQHRAHRPVEAHRLEVLDGIDRGAIHELEHRQAHLRADVEDGLGRSLEGGERGDEGRRRQLRGDEGLIAVEGVVGV